MAEKKKSFNPTQTWICTKCAHRRSSSTKPDRFGCTKAPNKLHTWVKV